MGSTRSKLLEQQLRDFLQAPSITVARVIIGEVDRLADRLDRVEKEMIKLRQEMKK
jgi:hypothetical protein